MIHQRNATFAQPNSSLGWNWKNIYFFETSQKPTLTMAIACSVVRDPSLTIIIRVFLSSSPMVISVAHKSPGITDKHQNFTLIFFLQIHKFPIHLWTCKRHLYFINWQYVEFFLTCMQSFCKQHTPSWKFFWFMNLYSLYLNCCINIHILVVI